jgi:transposase
MPSVFDKKANETEKLKKQFEAEKAALERKIGELTIDIDWLKKTRTSLGTAEKKKLIEHTGSRLTVNISANY